MDSAYAYFVLSSALTVVYWSSIYEHLAWRGSRPLPRTPATPSPGGA